MYDYFTLSICYLCKQKKNLLMKKNNYLSNIYYYRYAFTVQKAPWQEEIAAL